MVHQLDGDAGVVAARPALSGESVLASAAPWPETVADAIALQSRLRDHIERADRFAPPVTVAGIDAAYGRRGGPAHAAAVLFDLAALTPLEQAEATVATAFPYVPGLLSFREGPAAVAAIGSLSRRPDVLMCDGQGIAHPRRIGIASHLGLVLDLPAIGVAKSRLVGKHGEPGPNRGDWTPLVDGGDVIGAVVRTREKVRPVFVSIGHRVSLETAIALVLACTRRFRLPEPIRAADRLSRCIGA
ncbi:MAG: deoxyribonuclease V [Defluviicoccus sp.]|nr:deoxyribonuclease V [Defluviicoccus sp.]MDG4592853.1 deoxyribonuclease V [Defluviicoccus sp.]MDS4073505.1 deoxyribonuclease V [Defluviicoccus sp.]